MSKLSARQVAQYGKDGFLIVSKVFSLAYVDSLLVECDRLWRSIDINESNRRIQRRMCLDGRIAADRIDPVLDISPQFHSAAEEKCITGPVAQLLSCSDPVIFKGKLISKWPQTVGYGMHQDYSYWSDFTDAGADSFVTALIALDRFDDDSGTVEFFPGLHHERISPPPEDPNDADEDKIDLSIGILAVLEPGDVVFFHGLTPHRSGPNLSTHNRQSIFFTYVPAKYSDTNDRYYAGRPADFMGVE